MKKKKLRAKLDTTKKKLAAARSELDARLSIMAASGMPRAGAEPAAGKKPAPKTAPPKPKARVAAKRPAAGPKGTRKV